MTSQYGASTSQRRDEQERQLHSLNQEIAQLCEQKQFDNAVSIAEHALELARECFGVKHRDYAGCLNNLAWLYEMSGNLRSAMPLFRQALDIYRTYLGESHPKIASDLINLGRIHRAMGDFTSAEPCFEKALEIRKELFGELHLDCGECLDSLADLYHAMGNYAKAEPFFQRTLDIRRQSLGDKHRGYALSLNSMGVLYRSMGRLASAEPLFKQALAILSETRGELDSDVALILNNLGELYNAMGNYAGAEGLFYEAMDIYQRAGQEDSSQNIICLNNLASLYEATGNCADAMPLFQKVLSIRQRTLGEEHPDFAFSLHNLAHLHREKGDIAAAKPLLQRCLEIQRRTLGEDHPQFGLSLHALAGIHFAMGDLVNAEIQLKQVLKISRKSLGECHPHYAGSLNGLATLYIATKDFTAAASLYRQSSEIVQKTMGERHPRFAQSLIHLAEMEYLRRDYPTAEGYYLQACEIVRAALSENHPRFADCLSGLAKLHKAIGKYTAAEPLFIHALQIRKQTLGEEHPDFARSLEDLARLYTATGRADEAHRLLRQAAAVDDIQIGQIFSIASDTQRLKFLTGHQVSFAQYLSLVWSQLACSAEAVESAMELVLRRKCLAAEALAIQRDAVFRGHYRHLEPQLRELASLRRSIAKNVLSRAVPEGSQPDQERLADSISRKDLLEAELASQIPEMKLEQQLLKADRRAVALALPQGTSLIEFVRFDVFDFKSVPAKGGRMWHPARYLAFILPAGEPDRVQMIDLGEAAPIDRLIAGFREECNSEDVSRDAIKRRATSARTDNLKAGLALRAAVFDKVMAAHHGGRRLLLAPDGNLCRLPFEVLPTADGRHLIDDYEISYVSTGRDVLRFGAASKYEPMEALVVADPDFDLVAEQVSTATMSGIMGEQYSRTLDLGLGNFEPAKRLEGTRVEGQQIASLLNGSLWLADKALEGRLKTACRSPRILHLATHGYFLEDPQRDSNTDSHLVGLMALHEQPEENGQVPALKNPLLRSGLLLAGYNTWLQRGQLPPEAEDGLLSAEDVSGLDLLDTELVVLSACHTGEGDIQVGEGVFGLRRSFVLAGAKTLVMSLWAVPDFQTQELMEGFYRRIVIGQPRAAALRAAQLAVKAKHPDPYFWGAFICQGDPGPLLT